MNKREREQIQKTLAASRGFLEAWNISLLLDDLDIHLKAGEKSLKLALFYVNPLPPRLALPELIHSIGDRPSLLVTEFIPPESADDLRSLGINYLDAGGNIFIQEGDIFIGLSRQSHFPKQKPFTSAFDKSGVRLIFHLLIAPALLNETYRHISQKSGISLGAVSNFLKDLSERQFIIQDEKQKRHLVNSAKLLQQWIPAFQNKLKKKLFIGSYRPLNPNKEIIIQKGDYFSGEYAAEKLGLSLKHQIITVYSENDPKEFIMKNRLIPHAGGSVELFQVFWNTEMAATEEGLCPIPLIYADLILSEESRNAEAAGELYAKYLSHFR
jgi:hypothetical protein